MGEKAILCAVSEWLCDHHTNHMMDVECGAFTHSHTYPITQVMVDTSCLLFVKNIDGVTNRDALSSTKGIQRIMASL
jgi:hypothetical protein